MSYDSPLHNLDQETPEGYLRPEDVELDDLLYNIPKPSQEEIWKVSIKWGQHKSPQLNILGVYLANTTVDHAHRIKASFPLEWSDAIDSMGNENYSLDDLPTFHEQRNITSISLHKLLDIVNSHKLTIPEHLDIGETCIAAHAIQCISHILNAEYDNAQTHLDILNDIDG